MIKIESKTLEEAYAKAATSFECSITELVIEVIQAPTGGFFGMFQKNAIIVAAKKIVVSVPLEKEKKQERKKETKEEKKSDKKSEKILKEIKKDEVEHTILNDTIMPASFVSDQDDEDDDLASGLDYTADYDDEYDESHEEENTSSKLENISKEVKKDINALFKLICFEIETIEVKPYDDETILIEFNGEDAALLIGKDGYRYKALSYMIFNWINSKYEVQLRLEIAEFLHNQEESISRYLINVCDNIDKDGRAQTKILDGVLVQIALKELREKYPEKYVVIRSTKDGLKYIIVNDYHNN